MSYVNMQDCIQILFYSKFRYQSLLLQSLFIICHFRYKLQTLFEITLLVWISTILPNKWGKKKARVYGRYFVLASITVIKFSINEILSNHTFVHRGDNFKAAFISCAKNEMAESFSASRFDPIPPPKSFIFLPAKTF